MMICLKNRSAHWLLCSLLFQLVTFKIYAIKTVYCLNWLWRTSVRSSYWELFLEINLNQKILELYIEYIEVPMQMTKWNRKHTLLWNKHEYSHSADKFVLKISLTHFMELVSFYALSILPEINQKTRGFLMFHWA